MSAQALCIIEVWEDWRFPKPRCAATFTLVKSKRAWKWLQGKGSPAHKAAVAKLDQVAAYDAELKDARSMLTWRIKQPLACPIATAFLKTRMAIRAIADEPASLIKYYV